MMPPRFQKQNEANADHWFLRPERVSGLCKLTQFIWGSGLKPDLILTTAYMYWALTVGLVPG